SSAPASPHTAGSAVSAPSGSEMMSVTVKVTFSGGASPPQKNPTVTHHTPSDSNSGSPCSPNGGPPKSTAGPDRRGSAARATGPSVMTVPPPSWAVAGGCPSAIVASGAHAHSPISASASASAPTGVRGERSMAPPAVPSAVRRVCTAMGRRPEGRLIRRCGTDSDSQVAGAIDRPAEASIAVEVELDRVPQIGAAEVGPQCVEEHHLGVRGLPQQEVRGALLPAGAHEQIDIGHVGHVEVPAHGLLGDGGRPQSPRVHLSRDAPDRVHDLQAPAVVDAHGEGEPVVAPGQLLGELQLLDDRAPQPRAA